MGHQCWHDVLVTQSHDLSCQVRGQNKAKDGIGGYLSHDIKIHQNPMPLIILLNKLLRNVIK